jgi:hypothetical protein
VSCEEEVTDTSNVLYVRQLVIKGYCYAGQSPYLIIQRTLPPLEVYDEEAALVKNAKVTITHNNNSYNLQYTPSRGYINDALVFRAGERYNLKVSWNGMEASASTEIPEFDIVKTTDTIWQETYYWHAASVSAYVKANKRYCANMGMIRTNSYYDDDLPYYLIEPNVTTLASMEIGSYNSYDAAYSDIRKRNFFVTLYDYALYRYLQTDNGSNGGDIFGMGGVNPVWNVTGDGVGLFIGANQKNFKIQ